MTNDIAGVILAGGSNSRFNNIIKAKIEICGVSIIQRILNIIQPVFSEIVIVTNTPDEFSDLSGVSFTSDTFLKTGPLGGIHAALKTTTSDAIFVFAGDMPLLDRKIIEKQLEDFKLSSCDILIPRINGDIEPLHAIYSSTVYQMLDTYLSGKKNYAIREFITQMNVSYSELDNNYENRIAFSNVNTPEDKILIEEILWKN